MPYVLILTYIDAGSGLLRRRRARAADVRLEQSVLGDAAPVPGGAGPRPHLQGRRDGAGSGGAQERVRLTPHGLQGASVAQGRLLGHPGGQDPRRLG